MVSIELIDEISTVAVAGVTAAPPAESDVAKGIAECIAVVVIVVPLPHSGGGGGTGVGVGRSRGRGSGRAMGASLRGAKEMSTAKAGGSSSGRSSAIGVVFAFAVALSAIGCETLKLCVADLRSNQLIGQRSAECGSAGTG
jgi:hypothetical protein